jgi:hypothetical protein
MLAAGAMFPLIALLLDRIRAAAASTIRKRLTRSPRRLAMIGGAGGAGQHGLEGLSGVPLRVVNDPCSVGADVDVRCDEARAGAA